MLVGFVEARGWDAPPRGFVLCVTGALGRDGRRATHGVWGPIDGILNEFTASDRSIERQMRGHIGCGRQFRVAAPCVTKDVVDS